MSVGVHVRACVCLRGCMSLIDRYLLSLFVSENSMHDMPFA